MDEKELAVQAKKKNVVDMAVGFTKMPRLFAKGDTALIKEHLVELLDGLDKTGSYGDLMKMHDDFYRWCLEKITPAKGAKRPSYGQMAKVFDVVLKVYVYYCKLPNPTKAEQLIPMLNTGIDTEIYKHLLKIVGQSTSRANLKRIDKELYHKLQELIRVDILKSFNNNIFPVQYDDIMWRRLNR
jgi:hypothetical protein